MRNGISGGGVGCRKGRVRSRCWRDGPEIGVFRLLLYFSSDRSDGGVHMTIVLCFIHI